MTLRLGTPSPGSASLQPFLQDVNISTAQKIESLKLLTIVLKNLADPNKCSDPKYRQLKLDNEKIRTKLAVYPAVVSYLTAIGFEQTTTTTTSSDSTENTATPVLKIPEHVVVDTAKMHHGFTQCTKSMELLSPLSSQQQQPSANNKRASSNSGTEKLSEKQKARRLLEEKQRLEREEAKRVRKQNVAMIQQDKYVRENDENWTSKPSAACAKTGSSISTFRDRHGEN